MTESGLAFGTREAVVPGWPTDRPGYETLAAAVQGEASRWNVPGIAVGLLHHAHTETAATGITSIAGGQPVTGDTIFQIGSISKVFTATLAMRLVDDGLLDLDEPVLTYVPALPLADADARAAVTLRHLFSHTAGFEGDRFTDFGRGDDALARSVASFDTLRQWFAPGELWSYCNAGFYLAGFAIERVCNAPFETVIRERLFDPLGLKTTVFFAEDAISLPHAIGHRLTSREAGHAIAHGYSFPRNVNPAGGIVASTSELLRFAAFHMSDGEIDGTRLLSASSAKAMREPAIEASDVNTFYGIGWAIADEEPFRIVGHGGATRGFRSQLTVVPDRSFAIAILTNGETGSRAIQEIESWALAHYLGFERPVPETIPLGGKKLNAFAGRYERHDGRFTVRRQKDRLEMTQVSIDEDTSEVESEDVYPLVPVAERRFRIPDGPGKGGIVNFIDHEGTDGVTQYLLRFGGRLAERVPEPTTPASGKTGTTKKGKTS